MRPKFIVIEGIDGAGTTTQTMRLVEALRTRGRIAHATREPSDGAVGALLREMLSKRIEPPAHPHALALLFAADRLDHVGREVAPRLARGEWVVSDRYDHSSIAYQSVAPGASDAVAWLKELNRHAPRPTLTIVLDVGEQVARLRRQARAGVKELFEEDALQQKLALFYRDIERHFPEDNLVHVDAERDVDEVFADVLALALQS